MGKISYSDLSRRCAGIRAALFGVALLLSCLSMQPAYAEVLTGLRAPSGIGLYDITLSAEVSGASMELEAWFEYREFSAPSTEFQRSSSIILSSALLSTRINKYISGLACGQRYEYRFHLRTQGASFTTALAEFATDACAGGNVSIEWVTTELAADVEFDRARLQTSVDPGGMLTRFYFEYGESTALGSTTPVINVGDGNLAVSRSWTVSGLLCNQQYYFRAVAIRDDGSETGLQASGQISSFTTAACPLGITRINIDWVGRDWVNISVVPDTRGEPTDVWLAYGRSQDARLDIITDTQQVLTGQAIFLLDDLACGTDYAFRASVGRGLENFISETVRFTTLPCDIAPDVKTLSPVNIERNSATLRASLLTHSAETTLTFEYQENANTAQLSPSAVYPASDFERVADITVSNLNCATMYQVRAIAEGVHGRIEGEPVQFTSASCSSVGESSLRSIELSAGGGHSLVTNAGGHVIAWGDHERGQLGSHDLSRVLSGGLKLPDNSPLTGVKRVAAGGAHSLALLEDGSVLAWGDNSSGQLGDGSNLSRVAAAFVVDANHAPIRNVIAIAAGRAHSLALLATGQVLAWGANESGQLGNNSRESTVYPVRVHQLNGIQAIDAGGQFSMALQSNGQLYAWGDNLRGQLGINRSGVSYSLAEQVNLPPSVISFATGSEHVIAIDASGHIFAWGYNASSQLTDLIAPSIRAPYDITRAFPQDVYRNPVAGENFSGVIRSTGELLLWGDNSQGQIGQGSVERTYVRPVTVRDLSRQEVMSGIVAADAGNHHVLALNDKGDLVVWGDNTVGQTNTTGSALRHPQVLQHQGEAVNVAGLYLMIETSALTIAEEGEGRIKVWLSTQPEQTVRVDIAVRNSESLLLPSRTQLEFTAANWNVPQTVGLKMQRDRDSTNGESRVMLNAAGLPSRLIRISQRETATESHPVRRVAAMAPGFILLLAGCFLLMSRCSIFRKS